MFSKYVNTHVSPLSTGRVKVKMGEKVPSKEYSEAEVGSITHWVKKGYLTEEVADLHEDVEQEVTEIEEIKEVEEVKEELSSVVDDISIADVELEEEEVKESIKNVKSGKRNRK